MRFYQGLLTLFFFFPFFSFSQNLPDTVPLMARQNLSPQVIANIVILGTKRTHDEVIYREITFAPGDTVKNLDAEIQRSKFNIINTLLFNYVDIKSVPIDSVFTEVVIVLKERWYIWPFPIFKFADPNFNTWWRTRDFSRTNYGALLVWRNFRGWNEDLMAKAQFGYSKEFSLSYRKPYLDNNYRIGMLVSANYTQQEEITVGTFNNKRFFYRSGTGRSRTELGGRIAFFYRKKLYVTHTVELRYQNLQITDSLTRLTNDYFFGNSPHCEFPGFSYVYRYDKRDNKGYPLKGMQVQGEFYKFGTSFFNEKNLNVAWVMAFTKNYWKLATRWFAATQLRFKYTMTKNLPYYFQQGLGYDNFVRGYEYYVIDGQHFGLFKTNLKFNVVKPHTHALKPLAQTNFYMFHYAAYLNLFFDAGYVWDRYYDQVNPLSNKIIMGSGIGLDVVVFYDKVVRFEYAVNRNWQQGFYIHFVAPI
jgi:outer membrane protein assembly factor BamA